VLLRNSMERPAASRGAGDGIRTRGVSLEG
jgi:hypothetical protein